MSTDACIYGSAAEHLSEADAKALITIFDKHETALQSKAGAELSAEQELALQQEATRLAINEFIGEAVTERSSVQAQAAELGTTIPDVPKNLIARSRIAVALAEAPTEVTRYNITKALVWLDNVVEGSLSAEKKAYLPRLKEAVKAAYLSNNTKAINSINKVWSKFVEGVNTVGSSTVLQRGTKYPTEQSNVLSEALLEDGITYNTPLRGDTTPVTDRRTLSSYFRSSEIKSQSVLGQVPNMVEALSETDNDALSQLADSQLKTLPNIVPFLDRFKDTLVGTDNSAGIFGLLNKNTIYKNNLEGDYSDGATPTGKNPAKGDPAGFLVQVDPQGNKYINPNVVSALGIVAYNWLGTQGSSTLYNDYDTINKILGFRQGNELPSEAIDLLKNAGIPQTVLAESLGAQAFKLFGLQSKPDIDGNFQGKFELALGQNIIATMLQDGLLVQQVIPGAELAKLRADTDTTLDTKAHTNFVKIPSDLTSTSTFPEPALEIQEMVTNAKSTGDVIETLFGLPSRTREPQFTKIEKSTRRIKNDFIMRTPTKLNDHVNTLEEVEYEIKPEILKVFDYLGLDNQRKMNGYITDIENYHITEEFGIQGKNRDIDRDIQDMVDFKAAMPADDSKFYFPHEIVNNMRVMMSSNTLNPQRSKIHRHLIGATNWNYEVKNSAERNVFKLAVSAAFGGKIGDIPMDQSIAHFDDLLNNPIVQKGIAAVITVQEGAETSTELQQDIMAAVELGREATYSLDGLVALSSYSADTSFNTSLAIETDGKTNGVALALYQTLTDANMLDKMAANGIYAIGGATNLTEATDQDSYEVLTADWAKELTKQQLPIEDKQFLDLVLDPLVEEGTPGNEFDVVTGEGRKLGKSALMPGAIYGASAKRIQEIVGSIAVENFYKELMAAAGKDNLQGTTHVDALMDQFNAFSGTDLKITDHTNIREERLPGAAEAAFKAKVAGTSGAALEVALSSQFEQIGEIRGTINKAAKVMFHAFNAHLQIALEKALAAKGGIALSKGEIEAEVLKLVELVPAIKTYYSNPNEAAITEAGDDVAISPTVNDRLLLLKTKNAKDYSDKSQAIQVGFSLPIKNAVDNSKSASANISKPEFTDTGISTFPRGIQAIDSAVAAEIYKDMKILNLFDAGMYSVGDVMQGTRLGNQAIYEISNNYNIVTEVRESLENLLDSVKGDKDLERRMNIGIFGDYAVEAVNPKALVEELKGHERDTVAAKKELRADEFVVANISYPDAEYAPPVAYADSDTSYESEVRSRTEDLINDVLGSAATQTVDFDNFQATRMENLSGKNSKRIFASLETMGNVKDTPEHKKQLESVLGDVVNEVLQELDSTKLEYDLQIAENGDTTYGAIKGKQVRINIAEQGTKASSTANMSAQETYVHEMVHAVTTYAMDNNTFTRKQIKNLFEEVKSKVTIEDFLPKDADGNPVTVAKTDAEYIAAKERFQYIFENASGHSLNEFLAFGLTNKKFIEILSGIDAIPTADLKSGSLWKRTKNLFQAILHWVNGSIFRMGKNAKADEALLILTKSLIQTNYTKDRGIFRHLEVINKLNTVALEQLNSKVLEPLQNYRKVLRDKQDKNLPERVIRALLALPEISKTTVHSDIVRQVLRAAKIVEDTIIVALARELIGVTDRNAKFHELLRISKMTVDQARKQVADSVAKDLLDHYSIRLDEKEAVAITKVLLKTDLVSLLGSHSIDDISKLLTDEAHLATSIKDIETQLDQYGVANSNYYKAQAENLGYSMATGQPLRDGLMLNAHNIANMYSAPVRDLNGDIDEAVGLLDQLATLQAIRFTDKDKYRAVLADVIAREFEANPADTGEDMNGIANTFSNLAGLKEESLKNIFDGNPTQMIKGYTHETYNPNIDLQIGTLADKTKMEEEGYTVLHKLDKAETDTSKEELVMYISKINGARTRVKTIASITNKVAKGTTLFQSAVSAGSEAPGLDSILAVHKAKKDSDIAVAKQMAGKLGGKDGTYVVPVVDGEGKIINYRYMMKETTKDTYLEKQNNFAVVLGNARGSVVDKVNSKAINRELVELMKEDYEENFSKNPGSFVRISKNSSDPKLREIYNLLPSDMKQDMVEVWGEKEMWIKEEFINLSFGFRKLSITNAPLIKKVLGTEAAKKWGIKTKALYTEKLWTDFVGIAKDMIVVKSVVVLKDNFLSNALLLGIKGVPFADIWKDQSIAITALNDYQALVNKRSSLQRKLRDNKDFTAEDGRVISSKIANLTSDIDANAVKGLIEEGLFQTIVEDLDVQDTGYSFKSALEEKIEPFTEKYVPKPVTWTMQQALMTHDTFVYQTLLKATQYSDFIARYTLYQHLTKNSEMSHEQALAEVIDTFINYDVPTSPELQWLNDTGFIMFTKFALRIQKIILSTFIKRPINALTVEAMGLSPTISDSFLTPVSFLEKFQNPVFAIPDTALNMGGLDLVTGGAI